MSDRHSQGEYTQEHPKGGRPHTHDDDKDDENGAENKSETDDGGTGKTGHQDNEPDDTPGPATDVTDLGNPGGESTDTPSDDDGGPGKRDHHDDNDGDEPESSDEPTAEPAHVTPVEMLKSPVGGRTEPGRRSPSFTRRHHHG
jgi:hypothetical protein